jgi:hypothetical protein
MNDQIRQRHRHLIPPAELAEVQDLGRSQCWGLLDTIETLSFCFSESKEKSIPRWTLHAELWKLIEHIKAVLLGSPTRSKLSYFS